MAYDSDQRRDALDDFLKDTKLKESPWEKASGIGEGTLRAFLKGRTKTLTDGTYVKLAEGATKLLGEYVSPAMLRGEEEPARSRSPTGRRAEPIPVWGSEATAQGGGDMKLGDLPIDFIRRSERLQGVTNPFAFYVIGVSMSPAIEHGDQVVINTAIPVRPGADCVFMSENRDGTFQALVKRLIHISDDSWRVRQFNPPIDFDLSKKKWARAHVISEIKRGGL